MNIPKFVDTKSLVLQLYNVKGIFEISLPDYQKFLKDLYFELYKRNILSDYQITYEVNSEYFDNLSVVYSDILCFDRENLVLYLKEKGSPCICNRIDTTLLQVIKHICNVL